MPANESPSISPNQRLAVLEKEVTRALDANDLSNSSLQANLIYWLSEFNHIERATKHST